MRFEKNGSPFDDLSWMRECALKVHLRKPRNVTPCCARLSFTTRSCKRGAWKKSFRKTKFNASSAWRKL